MGIHSNGRFTLVSGRLIPDGKEVGVTKLLLRPAEVAEVLGIGRTRVYALIGTGDIPSIRIGGSVRVPVDSLKAWVARQATEGATATASQ